MAIPDDITKISTNLPMGQLRKVLNALEKGEVVEVKGSSSMFAESANWKIDFEDARYDIHEFCELVDNVSLISGKPAFIKSLIDELEIQLSEIIKDRGWGRAKYIDAKIQSLKKILLN